MKAQKHHTAGSFSYLSIMLAAAALSLTAAAATAQEDDGAVIEEIVVSAKFQRALASAIQQKQVADTQIEAIGLEDIGVLPAISIADAIATLPGVAGARTDDGNISQLSIRGSTDLALGLLNGREQVTVTSTRNVEFIMYPPNVMTAVQVHKTQRASLPEGGLSGVINMETIKPMDFGERSITLNADVENYALADDVINGDEWGGRGSVTYIDQLSDTFGLALAATYASELVGRDGDVTPFEWRAFSGGFGAPADVDGDGIEGDEFVPAGFNLENVGGDETRTSFFAALQNKGEIVDINFDLLVSEREQDTQTYGYNFQGLEGASGTLVDPQINDRIVGGQEVNEYFAGTITVPGTEATGFGSGGSFGYNQFTKVEQDIVSTGLNVAVYGDLWTFDGDLSYSSAENQLEILNGTINRAPSGGFGGPTFTLTYNALGETPTLSVAENMTDPSIFVPRQFQIEDLGSEDELLAFRLGALRELNDEGLTAVSFGARYMEREKDYVRTSNRFTSAVIPDDPALPLDASFINGIVTPDNGPAYIAWNVPALTARFSQMIPQADAALPPPLAENTLLAETGTVEEDTLSAFVQLDFDFGWGNGNIGVRYVTTDVAAPGWTTPARETVPAQPIAPEHDYSETLPSLNLSFPIGDTQFLRLGLARVMNRPPLDDMRSSEQIFISGFGANGNAGNPELDPTVADQISASYEWYFDDAASLVLAVYYNDLDTFIGTDFVTRPVIDVGGNVVDVVFQVPGNGDGGYIRGAEFALTTDFGFITAALESLGTTFNYAYTDSNVLPVAPAGQGVALTGLSEDVAFWALWWVAGNFEARVGFDYRSEYIEPNVFGNFLHVDETLLTNFQVSYDFSENFRIGLFGRNIGDEVRRKYTFDIADRTEFNRSYREVYGIKLFYQF